MSKKQRYISKLIFKILLTLLIVLGGISISIYTWVYSNLSKIHVDTNTSNNIVSEPNINLTEPVNILLYGIDNVPDSSANRSDTMMVIHYSPKSQKITVVSLPRDTQVPSNIYYDQSIGRLLKLTEVHYSSQLNGNLDTAVSDLTNTIEQFFDIKLNYYVRVDYKALSAMVDLIGGVDVIPFYNMKYQEYEDASQGLMIDFNKNQEYHLDGKEALGFVRWRKNNFDIPDGGDGGDLCRINNQRIFINSFIDKVTSSTGLLKIIPLVNTASNYITTNIPPDRVLDYALTLSKVNKSNIIFETVQGYYPPFSGGQPAYFIYEPSESEAIISILNEHS